MPKSFKRVGAIFNLQLMKTKTSFPYEKIIKFKRLNSKAMFQVRGGGDDDPPSPGGAGTEPIPPVPPPK